MGVCKEIILSGGVGSGQGQGQGQGGIIPNTFGYIFEAIERSENMQFLVRASFMEIYNEEIRDLLSKEPKNKLVLKENKESVVNVKGLNAFVVKSIPEIMNVLEVWGGGNSCMYC